ncbi:hypothetical protein [Leptolyngbya ohadii]|nr:hypothetical protein [Leptolyngbya ohadii]
MADPNKLPSRKLEQNIDKNTIKIDPVTVVMVIFALLLLPLLFSGFLFQ